MKFTDIGFTSRGEVRDAFTICEESMVVFIWSEAHSKVRVSLESRFPTHISTFDLRQVRDYRVSVWYLRLESDWEHSVQ